MQERTLTLPEIMLIAGTRAALGVGIGLLLSGKLDRDTRRGAGWALLAVGAVGDGLEKFNWPSDINRQAFEEPLRLTASWAFCPTTFAKPLY